jgi:hypothetical protein
VPWKISNLQQAAGFLRDFAESCELAGDSGLEFFDRIPWLTHICHSLA